MTKHHSVISRRDFLKEAGLGALASTLPLFHDEDELISNSRGMFKNPWWVKDRSFNDATTEVDIKMYARYDRRHMYDDPYDELDRGRLEWAESVYGFSHADNSLGALKSRKRDLWIHQARNNVPGMSLRDQALHSATFLGQFQAAGQTVTYMPNEAIMAGVQTPEERGLPRWQGTPEENLKMVQVAGRFMGGYSIGIIEMNDFNRHFIWASDGQRPGQGKDIVFSDDPVGSETSTRKVVSTSCRHAIVIVNAHPEATIKTAPGCLASASLNIAHKNMAYTYAYMIRFLRSLGYQGYYLQEYGAQSLPVMSGLGEKARPGLLLTPGRGPMVRKMDAVLTDLPLPPTPPIDAGMNRFCHTCKKCADRCPTAAISQESEPTWETTGPWNAAGVKTWHFMYPLCSTFESGWAPGFCCVCMACCPFAKLTDAPIHQWVSGAVATTPLFNGFFRTMDDIFGYGKNWGAEQNHTEDNYIDEWWNTLGPEFGLRTFEGSMPRYGTQ